MIIYKHFFITEAESWYSPEPVDNGIDLLRCYQLAVRPADERTVEFKTIWIDLGQTEEELFAKLRKSTRNDIRRASADGAKYDYWTEDPGTQLELFCEFVDTHSVVNYPRREVWMWTRRHAQNGTLDLSRTMSNDGRTLAWHAYYRDREHARLRYSVSLSRARDASPLRNLVSRAHRYQHWEDIKRFKAGGVLIYDLGGWYSGTDDEKLLRVNQFKEGFGGRIVTSFHCTRPLTAKGRLYLWSTEMLRKSLRLVRNCAFAVPSQEVSLPVRPAEPR
jgi:hypothetical protein